MAVWKRHVWEAARIAVWVAAWGALLLGGCGETRSKVLPPPGQTTQSERPRDWLEQLLKTLPEDDAGVPDMAQALDRKLIQPQAGINPEAKPQPVMSLAVKLGPMPVVFSHKDHTPWLSCTDCHPAPFKMGAGADKMKMADLYVGKYCGKCHGKVAFPITTGCGHCHPGMPGGVKAATAKAKPLKPVRGDIAMTREGFGGIAPAIFPHLPHRVLFRCYVCHDQIFPMKREPEPSAASMDPMMHGKQCGVCHNGSIAFGVAFDTCSRCHP